MRRFALVCFALVITTACGGGSQPPSSPAPAASPDMFGAPAPTGDYPNRVEDLTHDLVALGLHAQDADHDFSSDFVDLIGNAPPAAIVSPLSRAIVDAVSGTKISAERAKHLANMLYASLNASRLRSENQALLRTELGTTLKGIGAPDDRVDAVQRAFDGLVTGH